ncbi:MAG: hypothetical protein ACYDCH_10290 [Gaiellaceae bacterium]
MSTNARRIVLLAVCASAVTSTAFALAQRTSAPKLARLPSLGVACPRQNACGRIGVAVWLAGSATRVDVVLLRRKLGLSTSHAGSGAYGFRRYWTGFIRLPPTQVKPGANVRVRIAVVGGGTTAYFTRLVYLSFGWG